MLVDAVMGLSLKNCVAWCGVASAKVMSTTPQLSRTRRIRSGWFWPVNENRRPDAGPETPVSKYSWCTPGGMSYRIRCDDRGSCGEFWITDARVPCSGVTSAAGIG